MSSRNQMISKKDEIVEDNYYGNISPRTPGSAFQRTDPYLIFFLLVIMKFDYF